MQEKFGRVKKEASPSLPPHNTNDTAKRMCEERDADITRRKIEK